MASYPSAPPENGAHFTSKIHTKPYPFVSEAKNAGKSIFVTGGARGIGRAIVLAAAQAGTSRIGVSDLNDEFGSLASDIITAAKNAGYEPPQIVLAKLDITDEESVRKCAAIIKVEFKGQLDALINNAGFMTPAQSITEIDIDKWWHTLEVNLKGTVLMSKYFVPLLTAATGGPQTLININSVAAHNLRPEASAYGTSKWSVLKFTEFLLVEAASKGLVSYCLHPGAILTDLARDGMPPETLAGLSDDVELVGQTVAWLVSERREWLSGRYLSATWDMDELLRRKDEVCSSDKLKVRLIV